MSKPWTLGEYEELFRNHPPTQPTGPNGVALAKVAKAIGRTPGAVSAQWGDARSAVLGSATAASTQLIGYLRRQGWL